MVAGTLRALAVGQQLNNAFPHLHPPGWRRDGPHSTDQKARPRQRRRVSGAGMCSPLVRFPVLCSKPRCNLSSCIKTSCEPQSPREEILRFIWAPFFLPLIIVQAQNALRNSLFSSCTHCGAILGTRRVGGFLFCVCVYVFGQHYF